MVALFRVSIIIAIDDGTSMLFWSDPWLDGQDISEFAPDVGQEGQLPQPFLTTLGSKILSDLACCRFWYNIYFYDRE
jgi:hypothetical protein